MIFQYFTYQLIKAAYNNNFAVLITIHKIELTKEELLVGSRYKMSERLPIFGIVVFAILIIFFYQISIEINLEDGFTEEVIPERLIVVGILA